MTTQTATTRQGSSLIAKDGFSFKVNGKGRTKTVRVGQRFWVTNCDSDQQRSGFVTIDHEGRGTISHGYSFTPDQLQQFFSAI